MTTLPLTAADHAAPPLPRKLMRHLIFAHALTVGSKVLVSGNGAGRMTEFLQTLRIEADRVEAGYSFLEQSEGYDAAILLVGDHPQDLVAPTAYARTADLLCRIKPAGYLLVVGHLIPGTASVAMNDLTHHIAHFPSQHRSTWRCDAKLSPLSLLRPVDDREGFAVTSMRLPEKPVANEEWRKFAQLAAADVGAPGFHRKAA
ncbi:hypothetical protein [Calycomorphotria hydatis]|uniref:Spermidine synthase n=1 Tax=Calycomorphotria hydatis TaxID=2528027 RepID=A0A517TBB3_9PLAN|nr:hypothetical protein [Calycomorphotria hydatis]QDT65669.1 hypothetical protein V22_29280 [Calycomorphotria hydatis]